MVMLFICMYRDKVFNGGNGISKHFLEYPPDHPKSCVYFVDIASGGSCFNQCMDVCYKVGEMFDKRILEAHMSVGDVFFEGKGHEGHSFGVLIYSDARNKLYDGIVMETTAWDMTIDDGPETHDTYLTSLKNDFLAMESTTHGQPKRVGIRRISTRKQMQSIYRGIYSGTGCLFFGEKGNTFGITLDDMKKPLPVFTTYDEIKCSKQAFRISMENFIEIASGSHPSCWTQPTVNKDEAHTDFLQDYRVYSEKIDDFSRSLRPLPQSEREYMKRMSNWGTLSEADVTPAYTTVPYPSKVTAFSCVMPITDPPTEPPPFIASAVASGHLQAHNCMHSVVYTYVTG